MKQIMILVLGMLLIGADFCHRDTESTEIEIVIVREPIKRHPYQEEYERMLYPVVRINSPAGIGSGVDTNTLPILADRILDYYGDAGMSAWVAVLGWFI